MPRVSALASPMQPELRPDRMDGPHLLTVDATGSAVLRCGPLRRRSPQEEGKKDTV